MHRLIQTATSALFTLTLALSAHAQETDQYNDLFANDRYAAGEDITLAEDTAGDLFAAGEEVTLRAPVGGTSHMAGRRVTVAAPIDGNLYAAGYSIDIAADIAGAATLFASEIEVTAPVAGNMRAFARDVSLTAPLAGGLIVAAADVTLDAPIAGDLLIAAEDIVWGAAAEVAGEVIIYTEHAVAIDVPASVAPPERITFRDATAFDDDTGVMQEFQQGAIRGAIMGFVFSVLVVALLATATIALAEPQVAGWRARALSHPLGSLWAGFLAVSTVVGGGVVLALTVIGIPLTLAAILLAGLAAYAGYVMGSYILGVGLWRAIGRPVPEGVLHKAGLAVLGALIAGLIALIPFAGWLFVLALSLGGLGTIVLVWRESRALARTDLQPPTT